MAKYELGAIYKINGRSGELYYVRLLTNDCYGVFSSLEGELNEETFAQTHYRLYFSFNSFPLNEVYGKKSYHLQTVQILHGGNALNI